MVDVTEAPMAWFGGDAQNVPVTGSPFTYTAPEPGSCLVTGGTVSLIQLRRKGVTLGIGLLAGAFNVMAGDQVILTYLTTPTLYFLPNG